MDAIASDVLNKWNNDTNENIRSFGLILNWTYYDDTTQLNVAEAIQFFSVSYELRNSYDYEFNPNSRYAGKYIVRHVIFITLFLELVVI